MNYLWKSLILGITLFLQYIIFPRDGWFHDVVVSTGAKLILAVTGIVISILSIHGLLRGEGKPKKYTDKDVEEAKANLERMYLREHGALPERPEEIAPAEPETKESSRPQDTDPSR